jgi:hypothetical protein
VKLSDLAEAFDGKAPPEADGAELDDTEAPEEKDEATVTADADVFFDETEDKATRIEALRRLVKKLR